MPRPIPPETLDAIRSLFFARLAEATRSLSKTLTDLDRQAEVENHRIVFALLSEMGTEVQTVQTMLTVFYGYLEL